MVIRRLHQDFSQLILVVLLASTLFVPIVRASCTSENESKVISPTTLSCFDAPVRLSCPAERACAVSEEDYKKSYVRYFTKEKFAKSYGAELSSEETADLLFHSVAAFDFPTAIIKAKEDYRSTHSGAEQVCLDPVEHVALWSYTGFTYGLLNNALRSQTRRRLSKDEVNLVGGINCALDHIPDYQGLVSRYVSVEGLPPGFMSAHLPGKIVRYSSFTSASHCVEKKVGKQFLIHSVHGKKIGDFSGAGDGECEVLFKPGTCFRIDRTFEPNVHPLKALVEMTEVPCPTKGAVFHY